MDAEPETNLVPAPLLNPYLELHRLTRELPNETRLELRKKLIWAYAWAIPSDEAVRMIAEYSPLIEVGAGTGYWAWLLEQAGARVQCFDREPEQVPRWHAISRGTPESIPLPAGHTLFLCWPPLDLPMAYLALREFRGRHVVYLGEWAKHTADREFHRELSERWILERSAALPNWPGFEDRVFVFLRKD